nr:MAG TPA_asm: zinc ribbon domain protein [Caudoviricetes sp.]
MCQRCECEKCNGSGVREYHGEKIPCLYCSSPSVTIVFEMNIRSTGLQSRRAVAAGIADSLEEATAQIKSAYNL